MQVRQPVSGKLTSRQACGSVVVQMSVEHWRTTPDAARGPTARIFGNPACCGGSGSTVKSPALLCAPAAAATASATTRQPKRVIRDLLIPFGAYVERADSGAANADSVRRGLDAARRSEKWRGRQGPAPPGRGVDAHARGEISGVQDRGRIARLLSRRSRTPARRFRQVVGHDGEAGAGTIDRVVPRPRRGLRPQDSREVVLAPVRAMPGGAQGRTRTGTDFSTRPSNVRVYQFRHLGWR